MELSNVPESRYIDMKISWTKSAASGASLNTRSATPRTTRAYRRKSNPRASASPRQTREIKVSSDGSALPADSRLDVSRLCGSLVCVVTLGNRIVASECRNGLLLDSRRYPYFGEPLCVPDNSLFWGIRQHMNISRGRESPR